ncbi:hypothetical protein QBC43DRAFT_311018 [Cladorrhinum sp. PSN259]|nr:hypothetical protein QBC43DRAFT_311018 [Cladorrhinum sp. PSN259]
MASFSRGLGPQNLMLLIRQSQSVVTAPCRCAGIQPQSRLLLRAHFSSSSRLFAKASQAIKQTPKPPVVPLKPAPKAAISPALAAVRNARPSSYAEQIALKGRTILYEAPSHFWFRFSCFSSGLFCASYSVYNYWAIYLNPPPDLYWWVPTAYGAICVLMTAMGFYFVMGTSRIVRSIEVIPSASAKIAKDLTKAKPSGQAPLYVEIKSQRIFPLLPVKKTVVPLEEVQLPFRMQAAFDPKYLNRPKSLAEAVREERAEIERKKAEREYTMNHLMTAPFRDMGKAINYAFTGVRRSFNREGFTNINVGKKTFKMDVTGGWALDNGRAMDRLLPVRPNAVGKQV